MTERLLFIDHSFHEKTQSSAFFVNALRQAFHVDVYYLDPQSCIDQECLQAAAAADRIVLWQMDFLAPVFLALGKAVTVVPMYDGSGSMPALHWLAQRRATHINFSMTLHSQVSYLGIRSKLVKYFKEPIVKDRLAKFDGGLRVFLWQRQPESGINIHAAERLLNTQIVELHIHNAPDNSNIDIRQFTSPNIDTYQLTVSEWFESSNDYLSALDRCNTFVCPRRAEGIGMAMLEAMARGMLIFAADEPTHNEYIANWVNGILFNPDNPSPANVSDCATELGYQAWQSSSIGYANWLKQQDEFVAHIKTAPPAKSALISPNDAGVFAEQLTKAYYGNVGYADYLLSRADLISALADVDRQKLLSLAGLHER